MTNHIEAIDVHLYRLIKSVRCVIRCVIVAECGI